MSSTSDSTPKDPLISLPHVFGSALAAACATGAASYFGIAGTIIGAVAASVVATVVSATSTHSLQRVPTLALSGAAVLAIVALTVTGVEGVVGRPLSSLVGGSEAATGTTIGRSVTGGTQPTTVTRADETTDRAGSTPDPEPEEPTSDPTAEPTPEAAPDPADNSAAPVPTPVPTPEPSPTATPQATEGADTTSPVGE